MTLSRRISIMMAGAAGLFLLTALLHFFSDAYQSHYTTLGEAKRDDAVARGWIPAFVPESARDIHEIHNLDTNLQLVRFDFEPGNWSIPEGFARLVEPAPEPFFNVSWQPGNALRNMTVYHQNVGSSLSGYLAIDSKNSRAYYWSVLPLDR